MVICRGDEFLNYLGCRKDGGIKSFLEKEISDVNQQNKYGETLIYVATFFCESDVVYQLLALGANPNIQNEDGNNSLHVAAYIGNIKLLQALVQNGGDLRLVNSDGQRPCQLFKEIKNHQKMKDFEETMFKEFIKHIKGTSESILILQRKASIFDNFTKNNRTIHLNSLHGHFGYQSGFGNYICRNKTLKGLITSIKVIINSRNVIDDKYAVLPQFDCGYAMKMYSKLWNTLPVSEKVGFSLESQSPEVIDASVTNQTIKEANILGSLRHPNILLLIAVNVIVYEEMSLVIHQLIFERCYEGSLYYLLHVKKKEILHEDIILISSQITDALLFCHFQSIIHCSLSSHAVFMVNTQMAKLGNFDNATEINVQRNVSKSRYNLQKYNSYNFQYHSEDTLYKWLAPEILYQSCFLGAAVDVYGISVIIWEIFTGEVPHLNRSYKSVLHNYLVPFNDDLVYRIPDTILSVLRQSFNINPSKRPLLSKLKTTLGKLSDEFTDIDLDLNLITSDQEQNNKPIETIETKKIPVPSADSPLYTKIINRKSNSLNCLSRLKKDNLSITSSTHKCKDIYWYKNMAALPKYDNGEDVWKYPSQLTEVSIEGQGNLSNETHRKSIVRGMKPASHQTGLSTSQTNICNLIGTADLIKTSSKGSLEKSLLPGNINGASESSYHMNDRPRSAYRRRGRNFGQLYRRLSPLGSKIANLIHKYESTDSHPYSSSNCSTPIANERQCIYSSIEKENMSKTVKVSQTHKTKKYFPSLKNEHSHNLSSTTDEENIIQKTEIPKLKPLFKSGKMFGDVTNKYN